MREGFCREGVTRATKWWGARVIFCKSSSKGQGQRTPAREQLWCGLRTTDTPTVSCSPQTGVPGNGAAETQSSHSPGANSSGCSTIFHSPRNQPPTMGLQRLEHQTHSAKCPHRAGSGEGTATRTACLADGVERALGEKLGLPLGGSATWANHGSGGLEPLETSL